MTKIALDRRTVLRGMLGGAAVSVALPTLDGMLNDHGTALAAGTPLPKRFGIFWWGCGVRLSKWTPSTEGPDWQPKEELMPLLPHKEYVSLVSGVKCPVADGTGHHDGRCQMLTGGNDRTSMFGAPKQPSIDQVIARAWNAPTRYPSLETLASRRGFENYGNSGGVSATGNGSWTQGASPATLYNRLFGSPGSLPSSPDIAKKLVAARQSVIDGIKADTTRLQARVGAADKIRLDQHLDGIRAIERRLTSITSGPTCAKPNPPQAFSTDQGHEDLEAVSHTISDLLVLALSCDLTRVFTFEFNGMQSDTVFWPVGENEGLHTLTHKGNAGIEPTHQAVVYIMKQLAYFVGQLEATRDGATSNLLDSLCLYGTTETQEGMSHQHTDMPALVIGRAGGGLHAGVHYRSKTQENSTNVLLTMLTALLPQPPQAFGYGPCRTTDKIPALLA